MNIKELKEISKNNLECAQDYFLKNNNSLNPFFSVFAQKKGKKVNIRIPLESEEIINHRFEFLEQLGIRFGVETFLKKEFDSIEAVFLFNEAWMSKHNPKEGKDFLMPSKDPKRMEVLISAGVSFENEVAIDMKIIKRKWDEGKIKISFEDMNKVTEEDPLEVKPTILEGFWKTFKSIEGLSEKMNKIPALKKFVETASTEHLVDLFLKSFYSSREKMKEKAQKEILPTNIQKNA